MIDASNHVDGTFLGDLTLAYAWNVLRGDTACQVHCTPMTMAKIAHPSSKQ